MPDLSVDTLKEVLFLNKIYLAGATLWAFVVLAIEVGNIDSFQNSSGNLTALTYFGILMGGVVSIVDATLECGQDLVYTECCDSDNSCCTLCGLCTWETATEDFKKSWDVDNFKGISYVWLKNRRANPYCSTNAVDLS